MLRELAVIQVCKQFAVIDAHVLLKHRKVQVDGREKAVQGGGHQVVFGEDP